MTYIGAIHIHSDYSHDGLDPLEVVRDKFVERGVQFAGMSEHAEDFTPELWDEYQRHCQALSNNDIQMIAGLEFRFAGLKGMHLLALGLTQWIAPRTPDEFFEMTEGVTKLTVLAHPVLTQYRIPSVVLEKIDAIEVWNAAYNTRYLPDPKSIRIVHEVRQKRPNVIATVGLDQHDASNDRETRTILPERHPDPLGEIRAGRFSNHGRTMDFDCHATLSTAQLSRLRVKRWGYDIIERMHERTIKTLRRIGVDLGRRAHP